MRPATFTPPFDIGSGHPVLALHSSMSSKSQWRPLAATLDSRHAVVAVDLHGYGGHPLPTHGKAHRLEDEVAFVAKQAIDALGSPEPMHVVGHSFGGAVALSLARTRPELVRSLTLYEPVCMSLLDRDGPYFHVMRLIADGIEACVKQGDLPEATRTFIDYWGGPGSYDAYDHEARQRLHRLVPKVPLDFAALSSGPASPDWYAAIPVPTLLMVGRSSLESVRSIAKALWAVMPRSDLVELPGDHLLPMRNPAVVNREIARFLETFSDLFAASIDQMPRPRVAA